MVAQAVSLRTPKVRTSTYGATGLRRFVRSTVVGKRIGSARHFVVAIMARFRGWLRLRKGSAYHQPRRQPMRFFTSRAGRWPLAFSLAAIAALGACADEPVSPKNPSTIEPKAVVQGAEWVDVTVTNTSG